MAFRGMRYFFTQSNHGCSHTCTITERLKVATEDHVIDPISPYIFRPGFGGILNTLSGSPDAPLGAVLAPRTSD
jgi:hypothetical protein